MMKSMSFQVSFAVEVQSTRQKRQQKSNADVEREAAQKADDKRKTIGSWNKKHLVNKTIINAPAFQTCRNVIIQIGISNDIHDAVQQPSASCRISFNEPCYSRIMLFSLIAVDGQARTVTGRASGSR